MKSVVYTAITGEYDELKRQRQGDWDYVAFTDKGVRQNGLDVRKIDKGQTLDNNRRAKWYKLNPHMLFPDYDISIWIDGSVEVIGDLNELIVSLRVFKWGAFKHYSRDCIFDEAFACAIAQKDAPDLMSKQIAKYMVGDGYPRHNGLCENTIIVRKHNDDLVKKVDTDWWEEVKKWSKRDQLSLNYVLWKNKLDYNLIKGNVYDNGYFKVNKHN